MPGTDTGFCLTLVMYYQHDNKDPYLCLSPFNHHSFSVPMFIFISSNLYFFHYQLHSYFCCCCFSLFTLSSSSDPFAKEKQDDHSFTPMSTFSFELPTKGLRTLWSQGLALSASTQHCSGQWIIKNMFKSWLQSLGYLNTNGDDRILILKDNAQ